VNARRTAVVLALGVALAGCGGDDGGGEDSDSAPTLPAAQLDKIENTLESALAGPEAFDEPGADVQAVECPADVEQKAGEEFRCEVRRSDGEGVATVTLVDEKGTDISYEAEIAGSKITGRQDVVE
jgi:Domain of unknown function (DUF4333)